VRDWLFVDDHAQALIMVLEQGRAGDTYNVGAMPSGAISNRSSHL